MILAIETSTSCATLALGDGAGQMVVREFTSDRAHNSLIFAPLRELLDAAGGNVRLIVAGTGPGSYSGVRVGISAALGVSLSLGVPLIGLPSVAGLTGLPAQAMICGDARRGSWWFAALDRWNLEEPLVADAETISRRLAESGLPVYTAEPQSPPFCTAQPLRPEAENLVRRAATIPADALTSLAALPAEPIYLQPPFITVSTRWKGAGGK